MLSGASSWYRSRAIVMAIFLLPMLAYLSWSIKSSRDNPVIQKQAVIAVVQRVQPQGQESGLHYNTTLKLANGEQIELKLGASPVPKPGEKLPLTALTRQSGDKEYRLDRFKWENEGPF